MSHSKHDAEQAQDADGQPAPELIPYQIPVEGSLGLLAVGYRGLLAWREKRAAAAKEDRAPEKHG